MLLITKSDLARRAGVSPQAVDKALKAGRISVIGKGRGARIDLNNSEVADYVQLSLANAEVRAAKLQNPLKVNDYADDKIKSVIPTTTKNETQSVKAGPGMSTVPIPPRPVDKKTSRSSDPGTQNLYAPTKLEAEIEKILVQTARDKIRMAKERGDLIDRDLVSRVFSKLYAIDQNEFKTLGDKIAPEIASAVGVSDEKSLLKINEIIKDEGGKVLKHIKRIMNDFLGEVEAALVDG